MNRGNLQANPLHLRQNQHPNKLQSVRSGQGFFVRTQQIKPPGYWLTGSQHFGTAKDAGHLAMRNQTMKTNHQPTNSIEPEVWATYRVIEKVFRLAMKDAKKGKQDAAEWLDTVAPDWKERTK